MLCFLIEVSSPHYKKKKKIKRRKKRFSSLVLPPNHHLLPMLKIIAFHPLFRQFLPYIVIQ